MRLFVDQGRLTRTVGDIVDVMVNQGACEVRAALGALHIRGRTVVIRLVAEEVEEGEDLDLPAEPIVGAD